MDEITRGVVRFRARIPMDANPGSTMPFVVVIYRDYTDAFPSAHVRYDVTKSFVTRAGVS